MPILMTAVKQKLFSLLIMMLLQFLMRDNQTQGTDNVMNTINKLLKSE